MKIFMTGASGFIGAHVVRALLKRGHSVTALVIPDDPLWRLKEVVNKIAIVNGRLSDMEKIGHALRQFRPEACVHLAWYAEPEKYLYSLENIGYLTDSLGLLQALINSDCRQVVMAGTCAEYDINFGYFHEDTPTGPTTLYAAAKLACCFIGEQIAELAKINFAWARIFYLYGPQEDDRRIVSAVIRSLQKNKPFPATYGEQVRDYVFVEDVADAFCLLVERAGNGVFNVSSGVPVTIRQLLESIGDMMGQTDKIRFNAIPCRAWEPPFICGDSGRLRELGWQPQYTLKKGLEKTLQWWESIERSAFYKVKRS